MNDLYAVVEGRFGAVEVRTIPHNLANHAHANLHMQTRLAAGFGFYPNAGFGLGYSFGHRSLGE